MSDTPAAPTFAALGEHIGQMLELAQQEADGMRRRAREEADAVVAAARQEAERVTAEHEARQRQLQRELQDLRDAIGALLGHVSPPAQGAPVQPAPVQASVVAQETGDDTTTDTVPVAGQSADTAPQAPARDDFDDSTQVVPVLPADGS